MVTGTVPPGLFFFPTPSWPGRKAGWVCLSWAHHPSSGLFILGPPPSGARRLVYPGTVPQQCNPWRPPRSPKQKQQPGGDRGGQPKHPKRTTNKGDPKGRGRQPANTNLEPKWLEPKMACPYIRIHFQFPIMAVLWDRCKTSPWSKLPCVDNHKTHRPRPMSHCLHQDLEDAWSPCAKLTHRPG